MFVKNDFRIKIAVATRAWAGENIHLHATRSAVRRGGKVGVVEAAAVLGIGLDGIIAETATSEVVILKIAGGFGKTEFIEFIVVPIAEIEKLNNGRGSICTGILRA